MPKEILTLKPINCSRCNKPFQPQFVPKAGGKVYCRDCTQIISQINMLEIELVKKKFNLDKEDEALAKMIQQLVVKQKSDEEEILLTELVARMIQDEDRKTTILKEIARFQKTKKG